MGRKSQRPASASGGAALPNHLDILSSVASLYADELKPVSRILRKRILERTGAESVCIEQLRSSCEACVLLNVEPCGVSDWAALLLGREQTFVNISSPQDLYPPELWRSLNTYWNGPGKGMCLNGGRYAFGQALQRLNLPCLDGHSFGRLCHIVQLALSQKKLLRYRDGCIGPFAGTETVSKEGGPPRQQLCPTPSKTSQLPVASWEEARACLQEMLKRAGGKVALANVKRMFHSQFSLELSETAFGHSRVSDLLRDPRLCDVCRLDLQSNGYMVVQVAPCTFVEGTPTDDSSATITPPCTASPLPQSLPPEVIAEGPRLVHSHHFSGTPLSAKDVEVLADDKPVFLVPPQLQEKADPSSDTFKGPRWSLSSTSFEEDRGIKTEPHHVGPLSAPLLPRSAEAAAISDDASKWAFSTAVDPIKFIWNHALANLSDHSWGDQLMCSGEVDAAQAIRFADGPTDFGDPLGLLSTSQSDLLQERELNVNNGRGSMFAMFAAYLQNHDSMESDQVNIKADPGMMLALLSFLTNVVGSSDQVALPNVSKSTVLPPGISLHTQGVPEQAPSLEAIEYISDEVSLQQSARLALFDAYQCAQISDLFSNLFSASPEEALVESTTLDSQAAEIGA